MTSPVSVFFALLPIRRDSCRRPLVGALFAGLILSATVPSVHAHNRQAPLTPAERAWLFYAQRARTSLMTAQAPDDAATPAPAGAVDLKLTELFGPIGDRGLEYSPKARALDGQTVRLSGYMVRQCNRTAGLVLLSIHPISTNEGEDGYCDDLPASTIHVILPKDGPQLAPLLPGRIQLVGRLELGPRPEADGRNSVARLVLTSPLSAPAAGAN